MLKIGQINTLKVYEILQQGYSCVLANGSVNPAPDFDEDLITYVYLANSPNQLALGDTFDAFVYVDKQQQCVASLAFPKAVTGQTVVLQAKAMTDFGAFFDWGLEQDLLVPNKYCQEPVTVGMSYVVHVFYENDSQRVLGATKLHRFFNETDPYSQLTVGQDTQCQVWHATSLGYKVLINNAFLGVLFHDQTLAKHRIGDQFSAWIKTIRDDGKIDITQLQDNPDSRKSLQQLILDDLAAHDGLSTLTDKSSPDDISHKFNVSKGAYKKAIGALFKANKIDLSKDAIKLK